MIPILNIKTDRLKVKEQVNGVKYTMLTLKKKKVEVALQFQIKQISEQGKLSGVKSDII